MAVETVFARWPFAYGGEQLSRGQIFEMQGLRNDEKLLRLGYCDKVSAKMAKQKTQCGECGAWFIDDQARDAHGHEAHRSRGEDAEMVAAGKPNAYGGIEAFEDRSGDRREKRLLEEAPLYLDKTQVSQR